jgi:transcriptional regulator with XRE-family HTH domain/quercetin dioxygenase-like cupin family protein
MASSDLPSLGRRIREERVKRGVSLRGLAREVGVSASMISQIETAKSRPSVSTLYAITSALGMSIEEVFRHPDDDPARVETVAPAAPLPLLATLPRVAVDSARRLGALVRPAERQVLRLDSGVIWEQLGDLPDQPPGQTVDFLLVTYEPGGTSSSSGDLMRHAGSEYGFLVRGELVLTLGFDEIRLRPGDAVSFDSTTPHGYRNDGTEPAVGVWFVIEQSFPAPG